ncbi:MAG TPA: DUF433 domain-containing protein [Candidatus Angelobacter sp.]|nr:DUF433 domain-containing protein [Candidatus Angelobacter sp.]
MKTTTSSPEILGGTPAFAGTRVPVQTSIECIEAGESIESFLEGFLSVTREQVLAFLDKAMHQVDARHALVLKFYFFLALAIASSTASSAFCALSPVRRSGVKSKFTPC